MFSGIIETTARVISVRLKGACVQVRIAKPRGWTLKEGQSIAVDGICSTVCEHARKYFTVEYMPETLAKTNARELKEDTLVNLERSLTLGSFVGGHLLQGHVSLRSRILKVTDHGGARVLVVALPSAFKRFAAPQGSIALNGVSLSVAGVLQRGVVVGLIPYTRAHTNLGNLRAGATVNVETDMIARSIAALCPKR